MEVFKVTTYYKAPHGMTIVNLAAACPTGESETTCGFHVGSSAHNKMCSLQVASSSLRI